VAFEAIIETSVVALVEFVTVDSKPIEDILGKLPDKEDLKAPVGPDEPDRVPDPTRRAANLGKVP
jgi:hypothetical protein